MKKLLNKLNTTRLKSNKSGFTLVELILVVVIVSILVGMAVLAFSTSGDNAKHARIRSDIETLSTATQKYYADTGSWPSETELVSTDSSSSGLCKTLMNVAPVTDPDGGGNVNKGPWLEQCPHSPYSDGKYEFTYGVSGFNIKETHSGIELRTMK